MKNRFLLILYFFISISLNSIANENKFEVSNIELENSGKIIIANNGKYTSKDGKFEVVANKFIYNKEESLLLIFEGEAKNKFDDLKIKFDKSIYNENNLTLSSEGDVIIEDKIKNLLIKSDKIIFDRKNNLLLIKGNVKVHETAKDYTFESEKITIDRKYDIIKSETKSIIQDRFKNILSVNKFELNKGIIKIKDLNFKDLEDNSLNLDSAQIDTISNELIGKDIMINLSNLTFAEENEPRIKGKSFSYNNNITEISKGVFTPCKKTEKCPPWQLSAEKIKHNKSKKTIYYENVWLKIYDMPVVYLPRFFHPDPTVKRQSGFLMPSFKTSLNNNTFLSVPYYKALSHDKDITFTPRFYAKDQLLLQTEYRTIGKNSKSNTDFSIFNEKGEYFKSHIFHNSNRNLDFSYFDKSNLNLRLETASNDTYLKGNNLTSPIISSYDVLESSLQLELVSKETEIKTDLILIENLNESKSSDKFHYIFPRIKINKYFENKEILDGNFTFSSDNIIQNYQTNIWEKDNTNNLIFESTPRVTNKGFYNNYEFLVKNVNSNSQNSTNYKKGNNFYLSGLFQFNSSFPMIKDNDSNSKILTPKISLKISPFNNTRDIRNDEYRIDVNNIFALNRLSSNNTVEGGTSLAYGFDYSILDKLESNDIFNFKIANNLRINEHDDLPNSSQLGDKTSNFFAETKYSPNQYLDLGYSITTKNNLHDLNYENLTTKIKVNNFITTFDYLNENNNNEKNSYLLNETVYKLNDNNSFLFSTRDNKTTNLTEYYNMMYKYENDCLSASIEYRKNYYNDRDIKPEESIFFKISVIPFGETSTPNLKQ